MTFNFEDGQDKYEFYHLKAHNKIAVIKNTYYWSYLIDKNNKIIWEEPALINRNISKAAKTYIEKTYKLISFA
jgi:hypothetical protein